MASEYDMFTAIFICMIRFEPKFDRGVFLQDQQNSTKRRDGSTYFQGKNRCECRTEFGEGTINVVLTVPI